MALRLRNDLYCVEWGVKLYSLTHSVEWRASRVRKALKLCAKRSLSHWRCFLYSYPLSFGLLLIPELNLNSSSINKEGTSYKKRQHLTKHYATCDVMLYLRNERSKIRHRRWIVTVRPQHETSVKQTKSNRRQPKTQIYSLRYVRADCRLMLFLYCTLTQRYETCNLHVHVIVFKIARLPPLASCRLVRSVPGGNLLGAAYGPHPRTRFATPLYSTKQI